MKFKLEWLQYAAIAVGLLAIIASILADNGIIMIDDDPEEEYVDWS